LQEEEGLLLTPFERNLEVWRQLWRVIERSHLIVQIVDARNPLLFRSEDLDTYVKEVNPKKRNLLLINKADFLTKSQRRQWADYFDKHNIRYTFFSAALAAQQQEEERLKLEKEEAQQLEQKATTISDYEDDDSEQDETASSLANDIKAIDLEDKEAATDEKTTTDQQSSNQVDPTVEGTIDNEDKQEEDEDDRTRIRTTTNLLDLLIDEAPNFQGLCTKSCMEIL
jgi:large subunit GTPase 1